MKKKDGKKFMSKIDFKKKYSKAKEIFLEKLELQEELLYDKVKFTMIENNELYIEGNSSVMEYYDNYIKIQTNGIFVAIDGKDLKIMEVNDKELMINGEICNIGYIKR